MIACLGIDPSVEHTGYALVSLNGHDVHIWRWGVVNLDTQAGRDEFSQMLHLCRQCACGMEFLGVAIEHCPFGAAHGRTEAQGQAIRRGQARATGIIQGAVLFSGLHMLSPVNVSTAKAALCRGGASKEQMIQAVKLRYGLEVGEHEADSIAVSLAALQREWVRRQRTGKLSVARKRKS